MVETRVAARMEQRRRGEPGGPWWCRTCDLSACGRTQGSCPAQVTGAQESSSEKSAPLRTGTGDALPGRCSSAPRSGVTCPCRSPHRPGWAIRDSRIRRKPIMTAPQPRGWPARNTLTKGVTGAHRPADALPPDAQIGSADDADLQGGEVGGRSGCRDSPWRPRRRAEQGHGRWLRLVGQSRRSG